jgi:hypothetical protein
VQLLAEQQQPALPQQQAHMATYDFDNPSTLGPSARPSVLGNGTGNGKGVVAMNPQLRYTYTNNDPLLTTEPSNHNQQTTNANQTTFTINYEPPVTYNPPVTCKPLSTEQLPQSASGPDPTALPTIAALGILTANQPPLVANQPPPVANTILVDGQQNGLLTNHPIHSTTHTILHVLPGSTGSNGSAGHLSGLDPTGVLMKREGGEGAETALGVLMNESLGPGSAAACLGKPPTAVAAVTAAAMQAAAAAAAAGGGVGRMDDRLVITVNSSNVLQIRSRLDGSEAPARVMHIPRSNSLVSLVIS